MAVLNDISIYKGEDVAFVFQMTPAVDITGWTIQFTAKLNQTDTLPVVQQLAVALNPASGQFTVALAHSQTNIRATTYYYDVQRIDDGNDAVLSIGILNVTQEVKY